MATYVTLYDAQGAATALDKQIAIALTIKANAIAKLASPTAAQKAFAVATLANPATYLPSIRNYAFAEYNTQSIAAIQAASDTMVQTVVNSAVDTLFGV